MCLLCVPSHDTCLQQGYGDIQECPRCFIEYIYPHTLPLGHVPKGYYDFRGILVGRQTTTQLPCAKIYRPRDSLFVGTQKKKRVISLSICCCFYTSISCKWTGFISSNGLRPKLWLLQPKEGLWIATWLALLGSHRSSLARVIPRYTLKMRRHFKTLSCTLCSNSSGEKQLVWAGMPMRTQIFQIQNLYAQHMLEAM